MARTKKTSPAQDFIEIIAVFPWWFGLALAPVLYFVCHSMTSSQLPLATANPNQAVQVIAGTLTRTLSSIGQYLLPFLCLLGSAASAWRKQAREKLIGNVVASTASSALKSMSWQEFELVVGEAFRLQGFSVIENGGGGADGGIDLILKKDGEKFFVQCKQWRALKVGVAVVRELFGVMAADGAACSFVVTCGSFTAEAKAFASGRNITLLDGGDVENMIRQAQSRQVKDSVAVPAAARGTDSPECPICARSMVARTAQRGANAGNKFWGCSGYPSCKGTASID